MSEYLGHETGPTCVFTDVESAAGWAMEAVCRCEHSVQMTYDVCTVPLFGIKVEKINSTD